MNPQVPQALKYTKTHEWVRQEEDDVVSIGITDHAQVLLGDMVFVELPRLHENYEQEAEFAVVESVKAAADVYVPLTGEVIAVNEALQPHPELVNQDPYGKGWICRMKMANPDELMHLLNADDYLKISSES